jgi:hypothetical protein
MKNNEYLALFVLGIGTLCITFLLLFALNNKDTGTSPVVNNQLSTSMARADVAPQPQAHQSEHMSMEVLDQQVKETFAKAAAYLGRGKYEETEHIALLERLEFYGGMSSINPDDKKTAQDLINDMGRLLTLKESVARQVQLTAQINAVESDVQIHLAKGVKDESAAKKLMGRIETLYAIHGLSEDQNSQLRTSLAALKNAYKDTGTRIASAPATPKKAAAPRTAKPAAPVVKAEAAVKAAPKPAPKAPVAAAAPKKTAPPVQKAAVVPKKTTQPVQKVSYTAPSPKTQLDTQSIKDKYYRVMTLISSYFVRKKYNEEYHSMLTDELLELSKVKNVLSEDQRTRLTETIVKMQRIESRFSGGASRRR